MHFLIGVVILVFLIGLVSRSKGDGFLDTLSSGCGTTVLIIVIIAIIVIFLISSS
jgi:hypothetical protein